MSVDELAPDARAHLNGHHLVAVQLLTLDDENGNGLLGRAVRRMMKRHQLHVVFGRDYDRDLLQSKVNDAVDRWAAR